MLQAFGREAAAAAFMGKPDILGCPPAVWRRNLCYMAACGVADPRALLLRTPILLYQDHAAADFLQRRLMLQRAFRLSAAQLYERHYHRLTYLGPPELARRLQFGYPRPQAPRAVVPGALWSYPALPPLANASPRQNPYRSLTPFAMSEKVAVPLSAATMRYGSSPSSTRT